MTIAPQFALEGGRTNQVHRRGGEVWKRYDLAKATPLFANDPDAEWCALTALAGQGIAPDPVRLDSKDGDPVLIYAFVEGDTHATRKADLARLLGRLHAQPVPAGLPTAARGKDVISMGLAMAQGAEALLRMAPMPPNVPNDARFCHRDAVPGNVVETARGPILIDWQCPAVGDPVEDIAHALSPAMHVLYGDDVPSSADVTAFLSAYPDRRITDGYVKSGHVYHWRMACYCHWQIARGNHAYEDPLAAEMQWLSEYRASMVSQAAT